MADAIGTLQLHEPLPNDVEQGLYVFGRKLLDVVLQPEALAFHRKFIAEAARFPGLAKVFIDRNPARDMIVEVLTTYQNRGAIELDDPQMVAEHFAILVVGIPRTLALLVGREPPAEEERRLRCAVQLFLDGSRPR
jgi:tagatose-1,6-bisphosphate aldolase non-catalytic subunit AgaZ/GatZ